MNPIGQTNEELVARWHRQDSALRRQDLLSVTLTCLAELGPRGTTGREICRRAGVSHGLLRHYFRNPQNLLLETYEALCNRFIERFEALLGEADSDPWHTFDRFFAELFSDDWASPELLGAWQAFWTMVRSEPAFAAKNEQFNDRLRALLGSAILRLPNRGAMPLDEAVAVVSALMDGFWLDMCLAPKRTQRERALGLCKSAIKTLLGGNEVKN